MRPTAQADLGSFSRSSQTKVPANALSALAIALSVAPGISASAARTDSLRDTWHHARELNNPLFRARESVRDRRFTTALLALRKARSAISLTLSRRARSA